MSDISGRELLQLQGDARLLIVAGSDTTAVSLTHLFYHLACDSSRADRIRAELAPFADADGNLDSRLKIDGRTVGECEYLNGCINESLRLNPPVPSCVQRITPQEGIKVGDVHVPGDAYVWAPMYALGHGMSPHAVIDSIADAPRSATLLPPRRIRA